MANYIFSYDLNGPHPTHAEMDKHIKASEWSVGRLLETVWYIGADATPKTVDDYLTRILSNNDRYLLATCTGLTFQNLLVSDESLQEAWSSHG